MLASPRSLYASPRSLPTSSPPRSAAVLTRTPFSRYPRTLVLGTRHATDIYDTLPSDPLIQAKLRFLLKDITFRLSAECHPRHQTPYIYIPPPTSSPALGSSRSVRLRALSVLLKEAEEADQEEAWEEKEEKEEEEKEENEEKEED
eukprot:3941197-Rhodomonas_salina.1